MKFQVTLKPKLDEITVKLDASVTKPDDITRALREAGYLPEHYEVIECKEIPKPVLSGVYSHQRYMWVYETGHKQGDGTVEVEFVEELMFFSISAAEKWFKETKLRKEHFINPRIVIVGNILGLTIQELE